MRRALLSFALITGVILGLGAVRAQDANTVSATCKDGTSFTGATRSGACRGHGGVQSWGAATPAGPAAPSSQRTPEMSKRAPPPIFGGGRVWVNTDSNVYHCPGSRCYGKTKQGSYMSERQAQAQGAKPDHGRACAS